MEQEVGTKMEAANYKGERERTTFRLPKWLHKAIKMESVHVERDMTDIIVEQLAKRYPNDRNLFFSPRPEAQPLEKPEAST
jgi:hypothetical protein